VANKHLLETVEFPTGNSLQNASKEGTQHNAIEKFVSGLSLGLKMTAYHPPCKHACRALSIILEMRHRLSEPPKDQG
jgi:hypothetical protein